jgi:hypothetical protein
MESRKEMETDNEIPTRIPFGLLHTRQKHLLVAPATLISIVVFCSIVLPAIALSQLALSVRRERLSRPV